MLLSVWVLYLHVCLWTTYVPGVHRGQKRVSYPLELDLQMAVNISNQNQGPCARISSELDYPPLKVTPLL